MVAAATEMKAEKDGDGDGDVAGAGAGEEWRRVWAQSAFGGMLLCANPLVRSALSKLCRWAAAVAGAAGCGSARYHQPVSQ